jgi:hypothetical protein
VEEFPAVSLLSDISPAFLEKFVQKVLLKRLRAIRSKNEAAATIIHGGLWRMT